MLHPRVFLLFELLDFSPEADDASLQPFAWGFLKVLSGPMSEPGHANALRSMPLRLQLYRWQSRVRPPTGTPAVWAQYLAAGRKQYSSTLYVTLRPLAPPEPLPIRFPHRPMAPHHIEEGRISFERLTEETARDRLMALDPLGSRTSQHASSAAAASQFAAAINARAGAPCQLPNTLLHAMPGGAHGATAIAIRPDGGVVAVALAEDGYATISIHEMSTGRRREVFHAHHRTIHELCWTADGERLASVSADGTAKLWQPVRLDGDVAPPDDEPILTLPHPSYVYCVRAQPRAGGARTPSRQGPTVEASLLLTGCNDHALRLWDVSGDKEVLLATKSSHTARINSIAWPSEASIFSADAAGVVKHWEVIGRLGGASGASLKLIASIEKKELKDIPINSVTLHPNRRRLLLQTRNHQLVALDTRLQHFSARYQGHRCSEYHIRASYSPDGRFVVAGSEDGRFFAWAEESGELLIDGLAIGFAGPLLQVAWSVQHDIIAMCAYGTSNPVLLHYFQPNAAAHGDGAAALAAVNAPTSPAAGAAAAAQQQAPPAGEAAAATGGLGELSLLGTPASERNGADRRLNRRAVRRAGNVPGGAGLYQSAIGGVERLDATATTRRRGGAEEQALASAEEQVSRRKAAARELRNSRDSASRNE